MGITRNFRTGEAIRFIGNNPHSKVNKMFDLLYCVIYFPAVLNIKTKVCNGQINRSQSNYSDVNIDIGNLLDLYGSDKSNPHNYHVLYNEVLREMRQSISTVLEIGIGSNNLDVVSNMGVKGKPEASLRAFRDWFPNAMIYGADIDTRILFKERMINTFYVNQLDLSSLDELKEKIPKSIDLIIIDGLHTPRADFNSILKFLPILSKGGNMFIEDVGENAARIF